MALLKETTTDGNLNIKGDIKLYRTDSDSYTKLSYNDLDNLPTNLATESYVTTAIGNLTNSAPAALDTLKELADALNNDSNFAGTVTSQLALKANSSDVYTKNETDIILDGKAASSHTHAIADVTNLQATLAQCLKEGTPANIAEKYYNAGNNGTINLANGHVQSCGASTITLPAVPASGTITLTLFVTATSVTWSSNIKWIGGSAPSLADVSVLNFVNNRGIWVGSMIGAVSFIETSESGRTFQRNADNTGTIMTWNDSGTVRRTVIFDAAYRTTESFYPNYEFNLGLLTYTNDLNTIPSTPVLGSDAILSTNSNFNQDIRGNTVATTAIIEKIGDTDCAAKYVRGLTSLNEDEESGCDLPTINCLCRIYNDRIILDSMDPTIASYTLYQLTNWFFGSNVWSSSWYGLDGGPYTALEVRYDGVVEHNDQEHYYGVIPVLDL